MLSRGTFLRHNLVLFTGSMAVGFLNYLYYPVMTRLLPPVQFGEVQTLVSILLESAVLLTVFGFVTIGLIAAYEDSQERHRRVEELQRFALMIALAVLVIITAGSSFLKTFFQFDSAVPFILLALAFVTSVPVMFRIYYLQSHQRFATSSAANALNAVAKLIASTLLVLIGLQVAGAIAGLIAAQIVTLAYLLKKVRAHGWHFEADSLKLRLPNFALIKPELKHGAVVLAVLLSVTLLYTLDIVAVKHYFSPQLAGQYAGIATVARIIFFLTGSIGLVLLTSVKPAQPRRQNTRLLQRSLLLILLLGGGAVLAFTVAPDLIIRILIGPKYLQFSNLLPKLSLAVFLVSIANLIFYYYLALRERFVAVVAVGGVLVAAGLLTTMHSSPSVVINDLIIGALTMLVLLASWRGVHRLRAQGTDG